MNLKNTDIKSLLKLDKKLVCFGAGKMLNMCCERLEALGFAKRIYRILDNNKSHFEWNSINFSVCTLESFLKEETDLNDVVFLITCMAYPEMFEQLQSVHQLQNVDCYIYQFVQNMPPPPYEFPKHEFGSAQKIPKKIHYIWFGGSEIPEKNREWMESWKKYCPDYEIIRWDENNYDVTKHPYMRDAYKEKKYAFATDYARLDIIYEHGGIYLDTDVEVLANLDKLLFDEAYIGFSSAELVSNGLGFGAVKGFGILKEMLSLYDHLSFYSQDGTLDLTAHMFVQMKVFERHGLISNNSLQIIEGMRIYPTDVFAPLDDLCNPIAFSKNTLTIHHYIRSWDKDGIDTRNDTLLRNRDFWNKYCRSWE